LTGGQEVAGSNPVSPIFSEVQSESSVRYLATVVSAARMSFSFSVATTE
jgi:hypothetical protein